MPPPAQAAVLVETDDTGLTLRTHDYETAVSITVPDATTTQTGASLLPLAQLKKAIGRDGRRRDQGDRSPHHAHPGRRPPDHRAPHGPVNTIPVGEFAPAPNPAPVAAHLDASTSTASSSACSPQRAPTRPSPP
ncbi:hypothetical protein [Streptomyces microflavus]|uniref:hypothetical protein n=1 Tax=Streptomyces microflavus TaxID=1919 RepID=UPI003B226652